MRRGLLSVLLFASCSSESSIDLAATPAEIRYVAVLPSLRNDAVGTPLLDTLEPRAFAELREWIDDEVTVVGWRAAELDLDVPRWAGERLRRARPDDPLLPPHSFQGLVRDGGAVEVTSIDPIALTSAWLPACPAFEPGPVETNCVACGKGSARFEGCRLTVDLSECGLGQLSAVSNASGRFELHAATDMSACSPISDDASKVAWECAVGGADSCRVYVHGPSEAAFEVSERRLVDQPPIHPSSQWQTHGWLGDLVIVETPTEPRLVVSSFATPADALCDETPSQLHTLTLELELLEVSDAPPCTTRLASSGSRLFAAFGGLGTPRVGELRADGSIAASFDLGPLLGPNANPAYVADLAIDGSRLAVSVDDLGAPDARPTSWVFEIDVDRQQVVRSWHDGLAQRTHRLRPKAAGWTALGDDPDALFALGGDEMVTQGVGRACGMIAADPYDFFEVEGVSFVGSWQAGTIVALENALCSERASFFESDAGVFALERLDEGSFIVGLRSYPAGRAILGRFDLRSRRFVPGLNLLGDGTPSRLITREGVAFAIVPELGVVVRAR
ncbi:MAG: hypothetical protein HY791_34955 [Deltaproteobacteria bacterium]|nr:hypothetical protein [Deltaproteobacteria bacterium]